MIIVDNKWLASDIPTPRANETREEQSILLSDNFTTISYGPSTLLTSTIQGSLLS
jgi:hypothetical protein